MTPSSYLEDRIFTETRWVFRKMIKETSPETKQGWLCYNQEEDINYDEIFASVSRIVVIYSLPFHST